MSRELIDLGCSLPVLPSLFAPTPDAARRHVEFFTANPHTRRAYARAAAEFAACCSDVAVIAELRDIEPVHVAAYIEGLGLRLAPPSVKQHLAAIRMQFDWLVIGQLLAVNLSAPVRDPKYTAKKGKAPVLTAEETRALLDPIDTSTVSGLRVRALIGRMVYGFVCVRAALAMELQDVYVQAHRTWVRLHEKWRNRWQTMRVHARPTSMTAATTTSASMRLSGS